MSLKKLSQFESFDIEKFLKGLELGTVGKSEWRDFETGERKGTKVETVIIDDKNKYKLAEGEVVSNMYEKLMVKIPRNIDIPMNARVRLINPHATVYGQYRNQLSITADDIEVISK